MKLSLRVISIAICLLSMAPFAAANSVVEGTPIPGGDVGWLKSAGSPAFHLVDLNTAGANVSSPESNPDSSASYTTPGWDVLGPAGIYGNIAVGIVVLPALASETPGSPDYPANAPGHSNVSSYGSADQAGTSGNYAAGNNNGRGGSVYPGPFGTTGAVTPGDCNVPEPSYLLPLGGFLLIGLGRRRTRYRADARIARSNAQLRM